MNRSPHHREGDIAPTIPKEQETAIHLVLPWDIPALETGIRRVDLISKQ